MNPSQSRIITTLQKARQGIEERVADSASFTFYQRIAERADAAVRRSFIARLANRTESVARSSWLYRWLTTEPEPDVIVIDLRETWTVGPVFAALDRAFEALAPEWRTAKSRSLAEQFFDTLEARPVQVVSLVALVAIITNFALHFALGSLDGSGLGAALIGLSLALAGTRITRSWSEIQNTRAYQISHALFEPPEPPDDRENR